MPEEIKYIEEKELPLSELEYAPWNWKKEAENKRDRFRASLQKNGILYRLVVAQREEEPDSDKWGVCDGNHRLREYAELGRRTSRQRLSILESMRMIIQFILIAGPEFVKAIEGAAKKATYQEAEVRAPFIYWTKRQVALRGKELGVDFDKTWSRYSGGEVPCGVCTTCQERIEALA